MLGGGSFRTTAAVQRYSRLDQYAMGLVGPADVPPFFYVAEPDQPLAAEGQGIGAAGRRHLQRHPARRADRGRHRDSRAARSRRRRSPRRSTARRSSTSSAAAAPIDPGQVAKLDRIRRAVGRVLPPGDRRPDAGRHPALAVGRVGVRAYPAGSPRRCSSLRCLLARRASMRAPGISVSVSIGTLAPCRLDGRGRPRAGTVRDGVPAAQPRHRRPPSICKKLDAIEPLVRQAIDREEAAGRGRARRPRRSHRLPEGDRQSRAGAGARADDARHDLRSRVADQGRGDDDQRDDAGRAGQAPAERSRRRRSSPASSATARPTSPSAIC